MNYNRGPALRNGLMGGVFYAYLFLISMPIFINLSDTGVHFVSAISRLSTGLTMNLGILLVPGFVGALSYRCIKSHVLKAGALGKPIMFYLLACLATVLCGQSIEINPTRWLVLGQTVTPFVAYFFLVNFQDRIRFEVSARLLVISLILQCCFHVIVNFPMLASGDISNAATSFFIFGNEIRVYGIFDYYPILFLTLVVFFHHEVVNKTVSELPRHALTVATIFLYAVAMMFHARNLIFALIGLFILYFWKRWRQPPFFRFFAWFAVFLTGILIVRPDFFVNIGSSSRVIDTIRNALAALNGRADAFDVNASTYLRYKAVQGSLSLFWEHPFLGIAYAWPYAAHNQYLSILCMGGVVPFASFMYLLWLLYRRIKRDFAAFPRVGGPLFEPGALYGIFVVFTVSSLFQNNFTVLYTSCIFWALVGISEMERETQGGQACPA